MILSGLYHIPPCSSIFLDEVDETSSKGESGVPTYEDVGKCGVSALAVNHPV